MSLNYSYDVMIRNNGGVEGHYSLSCAGHSQIPCSVSPSSFTLPIAGEETVTITYRTMGLGSGFTYSIEIEAAPGEGDAGETEANAGSYSSGSISTYGPSMIRHLVPLDQTVIYGSDTLRAEYDDSSGISSSSVTLRIDGKDSTGRASKTSTEYTAALDLKAGSHTWTTYACAYSGRCDTYTTVFTREDITNYSLDDSLASDGSVASGFLLGPLNPPADSLRGCALYEGSPEISFVNPRSFLTQSTPTGIVYVAVIDTNTTNILVTTQSLAWISGKSKECGQLNHLNRSLFDYTYFPAISPVDPRWGSYPYGDLAYGQMFKVDEFDWLEPDAIELALAEPRHGPRPPLAPRMRIFRAHPSADLTAAARRPGRPVVLLPDPGPIDTLSWKVWLNGNLVINNSLAVAGSGVTVSGVAKLQQTALVSTTSPYFYTNTNGGWNELIASIADTSGRRTKIRTRFLTEGGAPGSVQSIAMTPKRDFRHLDQGECAAFGPFQCDGVVLTASLPGFVTRDKERGVNLIYRSASQKQRITIPLSLAIARTQRAPDSLWVTPIIGGVAQTARRTRYAGSKGTVTGPNASTISETRDEVRIVGAEIDSSPGEVDIRKVTYSVRNFYSVGGPFIDDTVSQDVVQVHLTTQASSRFGQGWQLAELNRLVFTGPSGGLRFGGDTAAVWLAGDGSYSVFRKPGATWIAPPGDNTRMVRLTTLDASARYVFYLENGASIGFRDDGWQVWTRDLIGNATTFFYASPVSNQLDSIGDPTGKKLKFVYHASGKRNGYAQRMYLSGTTGDSATVSVFEYDTVSNTNAVRLARVRTLHSATQSDSVRFTYRTGVAYGAFVDSVIAAGDTINKRMVSQIAWDTVLWTPEKLTRPLGGIASIRFVNRRASPRIGYGRGTQQLERTLHVNQWMGTYVPFAGKAYDYTTDNFGGPTWVKNDPREAVYTPMISANVRHIVRDSTGRAVRIVKNRYNPSEADSAVYVFDNLGRVTAVYRTTLAYAPGISRTLDTLTFAYDTATGFSGGQWCSRLTSVRDAFNVESKFLYAGTGAAGCLLWKAIGTASDTTIFTYGSLAVGTTSGVRPVSIRDVFGYTTSVTYDSSAWNSATMTQWGNTVTTAYYDRFGRPDSIKDPANTITRFLRDRSGRVTHSRTGSGSLAPVTRVTYNATGQISRTDIYGVGGNDLTDLPGTVQSTYNYFDALGRPDSVINPGSRAGTGANHKARKQSWKLRDGHGNPTWEYPGNGLSILRIYDERGNVTHMAQGPAWTSASADGERRADTRTQAWVDSMHLTMGKAYSNGSVHKYTYDAKGRISTAASDDNFLPDTSLANWTYEYSRADQLIREQLRFIEKGGALIVRKYEYNRRGQRTKATDNITASGVPAADTLAVTTYHYDSTTARLDSVVTSKGGSVWAKVGFRYDRGGRDSVRTVWLDGEAIGTSTTTTYNALGQVTGITTTSNGTTRYSASSYSYNSVGDLSSYTSNEPGSGSGSHSYTYSTDGTRRLLNSTEGITGTAYSYDVLGNRSTEYGVSTDPNGTLCHQTMTSLFGPDNRVVTRTPAAMSTNCRKTRYFTDQAGRTVGESDTTQALQPGLPPIAGLRSLTTFTPGGQLYWSVTNGGTQYDFNWNWYDGSGRRLIAQIGSRSNLYPWPHPDSLGTRTYYVYDGNDVAIELVRTGNSWSVDRRFLSGGLDRPLAAKLQNRSRVFIHDRQGSVVNALDSVGVVVTGTGYFTHDAYGKLINVTGGGGQPMGGVGYAGAGTPNARGGFVYFRNRWYDPQSGRFLTQDPIGLAGGVNLYAYAGNNPVNFSDPFGLSPAATCPPCVLEGVEALPIPGAKQLGAVAGLLYAAYQSIKAISDATTGESRRDDGGVTVRLQAQGGGLEASVIVQSGSQGKVTAADAISGLGALQGKLTPKQNAERTVAMQKAVRYVLNALAGGGTDRSKSFPNGPRTDIRIDVEVLRGTAFTEPARSDAIIK